MERVPGCEFAGVRRRRNGLAGIEEGSAMKTLIVVIGTIVVLIVLVSSGVLGGAICVNNVGCLSSQGDGITVNSNETVTVSAGNP
jgi:hypothetical protein